MISSANKPQMYGPSRAGQLVKRSIHAPAAHQAQGHVHSFVAGSVRVLSSRLSEFRSTGPELRALGIFSRAEGGDCNLRLAKPVHYQSADDAVRNAVQPFKRHFKLSVRYVHRGSAENVDELRKEVGEIKHV